MKAALLHLVFDVAAALLAHIAEHLGEHPFQGIIANLTARRTIRILHRLVAIVADVERGAIEMARVLSGIAVATTQFYHIFLRTEHTGNYQLMEGHTLHVKTIVEGLSDVLQQDGCMGHQIRNAGIKRVDMIVR